jgi:hypothetical protein
MTVEHNSLISRADIEAELRIRAHKDKDFRCQLLTDPHTTLQQHYPQWFANGNIPQEISFKIIEEEAQTLSIVLPQPQDDEVGIDEASLAIATGAGLIQEVRNLAKGIEGISVEPKPKTRKMSKCCGGR